ncbi:MAG: hypothetical protein NPIRA05_12800 [Nitrospirales bacterium]|nr:MAG: hypothetical protein NPIRA05_12800 [Nitrospirales bacterium]GJL70564.1 MAG: hypothetical protein NPIRA06_31990 [Nitrospirales bacterium]
MNTESEVKKELDALLEETPELFKLCTKVDDILAFGTKYQNWYTRATKLIELLGSDRVDEFRTYYRRDTKRKNIDALNYVIQDYIAGIGAYRDNDKPLWDIHQIVTIRVYNQVQILASLKSRLGSVLADVRGHLLAEIEDEELDAARKLLKVNLRAAGAVAGVVIESHLQRIAVNHSLKVSKKDPTIADLNDPLKHKGIYDLPTWRKIQHLADLRNLCDHKKSREPTEQEVVELISGVASLVKNIH